MGNEIRYRSLFEQAGDGLITWDWEGAILDVNEKMCHLFGYGRKEFKCMKMGDILQDTPDARRQWKQVLNRVLEKGEIIYEGVFRLKSGESMFGEFSSKVVTIDEQTVIVSVIRDNTSRIKAEKRLREYTQFITAITDTIPVIVYAMDMYTLSIVYANKGMEKILGFSSKEAMAMGRSFLLKQIHPDDLQRVLHFQDDVKRLGDGEVLTIQYRICDKQGQWHTHRSFECPMVRNDAGILQQKAGVAIDITEQKLAEEQLNQSANFKEALLESVPTPVFYKDRDGRYQGCNRAFTEVMGITDSEIRGKTVFELWPEELAVQYHRMDMELMENPQRQVRIYEVKDKNGIVRPVIFAKNVYRNYEGDVAGLVGAFLDISEQKKAQEELAEQKMRLDYILQGTNVGTWEWNVQTGEAIFNQRWAEIIGYTLAELSPISVNTWFSFCHPDDLLKAHTLLQRCFDGQMEYYRQELSMRHKSGKWVWVLSQGKVASWTDDGKPLWMYGTHQDITDRKMREARIQESLREKNTLLQEIYHRTRNNMEVISSFLELQAASADNREVDRIVRESIRRIRTMALAHEKLYLAKSLSRINMKEYITDLTQLIAASSGVSPQQVSTEFDLEEIESLIDIAIPSGLIINELLSNAFKHAFPGERTGQIRISLHKTDDKEMLELSIQDYGIGLPRGFDIKKTSALGMQIVFQIIQHQLHGTVTVESDHGLLWRVRFPTGLYTQRV